MLVSANNDYHVGPGLGVHIGDTGINVGSVLRRAKLPADLFNRGSVRLKPEEYYSLWQGIEVESGDPNIALRLGQAVSVETLDPPIFAALCSPNLVTAVRRVAIYKRLVCPMRLDVELSETDLRIEFQWPNIEPPPPSLAIADIVFWIALARLATRSCMQPTRVTSIVSTDPTGAFNEYFGVPISVTNEYSVTFSRLDAQRPFLTANESTWELFRPDLRRRLKELDATATTSVRVSATLLELLPVGAGNVKAVSRSLLLSPRTLQRRLESEGVTFQGILNETRESLARHYLNKSSMTTTDIAFLLGYDEPSSFYRAFHSWTGLTPEHARLAK